MAAFMPTTKVPQAKPAPQRRSKGAAAAAPSAEAGLAHWTITLRPGADMAQAARALHASGLVVTDQLDTIGVINGAAPQRLLARLRQVAGVADVSPLLGFDIGPPGSAVS